jgi:hypothetical protein
MGLAWRSFYGDGLGFAECGVVMLRVEKSWGWMRRFPVYEQEGMCGYRVY